MTLDEFTKSMGGGRYVCVPESEAENADWSHHKKDRWNHTYEQWKRYKPNIENHPELKGFVPEENQTLYIWEYHAGFLCAGGGVIIVDDNTREVLKTSQFWVS